MSRRIKQMKEIWRNLDGPPKIKNLCSQVVVLNLVGQKWLI